MRFSGIAIGLLSIVLASGCTASDRTGEGPDEAHARAVKRVAAQRAAWEAWPGYLAAVDKAEHVDGWKQRCLAYPDLPGNQWVPGAARGRCLMLSETQKPTLKEISATLEEPDGVAKLDREYTEILDAHFNDPIRREAIFNAYKDFGSPDGQRVAATWLARAPQSAYAQMAMGEALVWAGTQARGEKFISEVPGGNLERMQDLLDKAEPLLKSALASQPRLSPACVDLMWIAQLDGDTGLESAASKQCLTIDPLSWNVNFRWLRNYDPRWGGSFTAMDAALDRVLLWLRGADPHWGEPLKSMDGAIEQIRARMAGNPALGGILVRSQGLRLFLGRKNSSDLTSIATELDELAATAPDSFYIGKAGIAAEEDGEYSKALGYLSQAIRLSPVNSDFITQRAKVRQSMGDQEGALVDARRALAMDDNDCDCRDDYGLAEVFFLAGKVDETRKVYQRAMLSKVDRKWAFEELCRTYVNQGFDRVHALDCTKKLSAEFPDEPQALYERASVLYMVHDPEAKKVAAHFHEVFDKNDPEQADLSSHLAGLAEDSIQPDKSSGK